MNSFWKSFVSIFNLFPGSKTYDEQKNELDKQMQDLYDRMGWGKYNYPTTAYNSAADINRVLEAENEFNNYLNDYIYNCRLIKKRKTTKDPARPRINKHL